MWTKLTRRARNMQMVGVCGLSLFVLAAGLLHPKELVAQTGPQTVVLRSVLHSVLEGHTLFLTVAEGGSTAVPANVTIEFWDASGRRRTSVSGTVTRSAPVRLTLPLAAASGLSQMRAVVTIDTFSSGSVPMLSMEDVDVNRSTVRQLFPCHVPVSAIEPIRGGGAQESPKLICQGWHIEPK